MSKLMTPTLRPYRSKILLFIVIFAIALTSCKKDNNETPPENEEFIIASNAKFIIDDDWQAMFKSIDSTDYTLIFDKELLDKYSFQQGDLIVSSEGNGLLRKIESVNQEGNNLQFETSQATLVDLIQQGNIDYKGPLDFSKIKSIKYYYPGIHLDTLNTKTTNGTMLNWNINTEIAPQIKLKGNFQYSSNVILQVQTSILQGLKKVKFGLEGAEDFNLALIAGTEFTLDKEITIATVSMLPILIPLPVPPFALVLTPVINVKLGLNGTANGNISTTLTQNITIDAGLQYIKDEGWSNYENNDITFDYTPPQLNVNAGAMAYLKPEINLLFYNVVGPYFNAQGYGKIEADLTQNPWWKMYYGFKMAAGMKVTILSKILFDYSVDDLLNWEQLVGQAASVTITTSPMINITATSASGGGDIVSDGTPILARGICWSAISNPLITDSHTSDGTGAGNFTSSLTGLIVNTPYFVRAYATTANDIVYGAEVSFITTTIPDSTEIYRAAAIGSWTVSNLAYPSDAPYDLELYSDGTGNYIGQGGQPFPNGGYSITWTVTKFNYKYYIYDYGFWHPGYNQFRVIGNNLPNESLTYPITFFKTYDDAGSGPGEALTFTKI